MDSGGVILSQQEAVATPMQPVKTVSSPIIPLKNMNEYSLGYMLTSPHQPL